MRFLRLQSWHFRISVIHIVRLESGHATTAMLYLKVLVLCGEVNATVASLTGSKRTKLANVSNNVPVLAIP